MEFVLVTFPTLRLVRMDGAQEGQTGQMIGVQRGTHIFDLGDPQDYAPPSVQTVVANTSQTQPLVIPFEPALKKKTRKRASRKTRTTTKRARSRQWKKRRVRRKKSR